jgi:hypothetical protein
MTFYKDQGAFLNFALSLLGRLSQRLAIANSVSAADTNAE